MKKAFTLIELFVTIAIIVMIAIMTGPALDSQKDKAVLDETTQKIRNLINETQGYARSPEKPGMSDYLLVMNFDPTNTGSFGPVPPYDPFCGGGLQQIDPLSYGIYSIAETNPVHTPGTVSGCVRTLIKGGRLNSNLTYAISYPVGAANLFKISFRTTDQVAGFGGIYYDYSNKASWDNLWGTPPNLSSVAEITVSSRTQSKKIKINNITGATEICLVNISSCNPI